MNAAYRRRAAQPYEYGVAPLHLVAIPPHTPAFYVPGFDRLNAIGMDGLK